MPASVLDVIKYFPTEILYPLLNEGVGMMDRLVSEQRRTNVMCGDSDLDVERLMEHGRVSGVQNIDFVCSELVHYMYGESCWCDIICKAALYYRHSI